MNHFKGANMEQGVKRCSSCGGIMHEYVDDRGDSYDRCSICGNKVRIFHERIDNRFNDDIDTRGSA